jgi:hypothetical protein
LAKEFDCSKNGVRGQLLKAGIELRESVNQATHLRCSSRGKQGDLPYFGFCNFEGKIINDPREYPTLQMIHPRWKSGKTIHQITLGLNHSKIPSRNGKIWSWAAVQNIINRFEEQKIILKQGGSYEFR